MAKPSNPHFSFGVDGFVIAILVAIIVSFIAPNLGAKNGLLRLDLINVWGIAAIFFASGANLSFAALKEGVTAYKLHFFVQITTFVIFPIIGYAAYSLSDGIFSPDIRLGFFFLCALPSTISSSVALTAISHGNVSAAVFNATLSNIIGMFATPLLVSMVLSATDLRAMPIFDSIVSILKTLLLPFILGQLSRPLLVKFMAQNAGAIKFLDRAVIIAIVFAAFCNANIARVWSKASGAEILAIIIFVALLLTLATFAVGFAVKKFEFTLSDQICALFCASQKSLASGAPIAALLFAGNPALSMIILPILVYHLLQLLIGSILAKNYASKIL
ncbi:MAG: Bile acid:sodium symporter [Hyphomonadaceae bacterium]|nr:MAG: Bile acid:sodium symporter [Hyphomonadaceae bacterium]